MKRQRKTYGINGMMEYRAVIKVGRSIMKVTFSDGSSSAMGTTPATYSTDSLLVQQAIENSDQFKRGRIRIISEIDLDGEIEVLHGGDIPADKDDKDIGIDTPPDIGGIDAQEVNISCNGMAGDGSGVIEVEFDNNDDARDYLEREFGYTRSKLRVRADIIAAGEANGVKIEFAK